MKLTRQHSPIKYSGSVVYKIKRFAAYNNYQELEEQREYAVNPFTSGARFIQSMKTQRASGKSWMESFKTARNRNTIAAAEREARVARDAVSANSRGLEVAQSNQATLKPLAETSGDIANVNAYNKNKETIKKLTNEQPALDKQLENKLKEVENLRGNKDLGSGVKDVNVAKKDKAYWDERRAAQEDVAKQLQAEEKAAKAQKPWDERRAAQENVGKQLQAEEQAAAKAQQEAAKAQQQAKPTNTNPEPQQTNTQQQSATPTQEEAKTGWYDGLSGWGKAGVIGGATAGISGLTYLGYNALNNNKGKE